MWASGLPSGSCLVHRTLRQCWAIVVQEEIAREQVQTRSPSGSVLVLGQEGPKLASFPEPLCACISILKKAAAPEVEEDLCICSPGPCLTGFRPCANSFFPLSYAFAITCI